MTGGPAIPCGVIPPHYVYLFHTPFVCVKSALCWLYIKFFSLQICVIGTYIVTILFFNVYDMGIDTIFICFRECFTYLEIIWSTTQCNMVQCNSLPLQFCFLILVVYDGLLLLIKGPFVKQPYLKGTLLYFCSNSNDNSMLLYRTIQAVWYRLVKCC